MSYDITNPLTWVTGTYPAGSQPWSGLPVAINPAQNLVTPGTTLPAPAFNFWFTSLAAADNQANDAQTFGAISNWRAVVADSAIQSGTSIVDVIWDGYFERWIADAGAGTGVSVSYDGGSTWAAYGNGSASHVGCLAVNPATGDLISVEPGGGAGSILYWPGATGVQSSASTPATNSSVQGAGKTAAAYFAGAIWYVFTLDQSGTTYTGHWLISTNGTTWTDSSSSLPTTSKSGTNHGGGWLVTTNQTNVFLASLTGVTPGTDYATLIYATNVASFVDATPSFFSGKIVQGLKYSATDGIYGVLVYDGTNSYLYTSSTPGTSTSWALVKTFTGTKCAGLEHVGRVWMTQDSAGRLRVSNNVAALGASSTWGVAPFKMPSGTFGNTWLRSNGTQAMAWTTTNVQGSFTSGWAGASSAY